MKKYRTIKRVLKLYTVAKLVQNKSIAGYEVLDKSHKWKYYYNTEYHWKIKVPIKNNESPFDKLNKLINNLK